jgi:hypothetical protein
MALSAESLRRRLATSSSIGAGSRGRAKLWSDGGQLGIDSVRDDRRTHRLPCRAPRRRVIVAKPSVGPSCQGRLSSGRRGSAVRSAPPRNGFGRGGPTLCGPNAGPPHTFALRAKPPAGGADRLLTPEPALPPKRTCVFRPRCRSRPHGPTRYGPQELSAKNSSNVHNSFAC